MTETFRPAALGGTPPEDPRDAVDADPFLGLPAEVVAALRDDLGDSAEDICRSNPGRITQAFGAWKAERDREERRRVKEQAAKEQADAAAAARRNQERADAIARDVALWTGPWIVAVLFADDGSQLSQPVPVRFDVAPNGDVANVDAITFEAPTDPPPAFVGLYVQHAPARLDPDDNGLGHLVDLSLSGPTTELPAGALTVERAWIIEGATS